MTRAQALALAKQLSARNPEITFHVLRQTNRGFDVSDKPGKVRNAVHTGSAYKSGKAING